MRIDWDAAYKIEDRGALLGAAVDAVIDLILSRSKYFKFARIRSE